MTAAQRVATKPIHRVGQGELHDTLVAAKELARLARIADSTGCSTSEIASEGGKGPDLVRVFEAMRRRGYTVGEPKRPQQQRELHRGLILWTVDIGINGTSATMAFYTEAPQK